MQNSFLFFLQLIKILYNNFLALIGASQIVHFALESLSFAVAFTIENFAYLRSEIRYNLWPALKNQLTLICIIANRKEQQCQIRIVRVAGRGRVLKKRVDEVRFDAIVAMQWIPSRFLHKTFQFVRFMNGYFFETLDKGTATALLIGL